MSRIERAPDQDRLHSGERASQQTGVPRPNETAVQSEGQGLDAYGCVDWFDYCPLPRTDPPVRRRS
jgi:hypothetical protein